MARLTLPYVYVMVEGDLAKIGISKNVEKRKAALRHQFSKDVESVRQWHRPDDALLVEHVAHCLLTGCAYPRQNWKGDGHEWFKTTAKRACEAVDLAIDMVDARAFHLLHRGRFPRSFAHLKLPLLASEPDQKAAAVLRRALVMMGDAAPPRLRQSVEIWCRYHEEKLTRQDEHRGRQHAERLERACTVSRIWTEIARRRSAAQDFQLGARYGLR